MCALALDNRVSVPLGAAEINEAIISLRTSETEPVNEVAELNRNALLTDFKNAHRGARTHDHKIKSLALYQLS